jgi:formamidopyrimidine-DNA glycosylase
MPELPDITIYLEALERRILEHRLTGVRIASPFLVRTFEPAVDSAVGRTVRELRRLGKRIVIGFDDDLWFVLHLMIAGRLHWKPSGVKLSGKNQLAAFDFETGTLLLTEAGSKRRAALWVVQGSEALAEHNPGGLEILNATRDEFAHALQCENHTLKRSLTDPRLLSGIGNAYSDEILHRAQVSPLALTQKLSPDEITRLHTATLEIMEEWTSRIRAQTDEGFPEHVTAFRPEMAVHGRFGQPCPVCGAPVQRIRYADNETNYCPGCQTGGKILADRSLSRLLKDDWPRHLDEL